MNNHTTIRPQHVSLKTEKENPMKKITLLASLNLLCALLFLVGAAGAFAQTGGEIIWSVDLAQTARTAAPRVAPSGDIYIHSDDLYAISPTGQILWRKNLAGSQAVDVGPDGTVYSGSGGTIRALTPAGQLLWSFTEPPGGQGLMAGPTVGADGNIYAVTDSGGLGAFSLTPGGQLIWNQPGYVNFQGTGLAPVPLTPTRLYFAEDIVPGCNGFAEGLNALDLDGNLLWCHSFGDVSLAIAAPNGDALVHDAAFSTTTIRTGRLTGLLTLASPAARSSDRAPHRMGRSISFTPISISGRLLRLVRSDGKRTASRVITSPRLRPCRPTVA